MVGSLKMNSILLSLTVRDTSRNKTDWFEYSKILDNVKYILNVMLCTTIEN